MGLLVNTLTSKMFLLHLVEIQNKTELKDCNVFAVGGILRVRANKKETAERRERAAQQQRRRQQTIITATAATINVRTRHS